MSGDGDVMPCPRCGTAQGRARLLLLITRRTTCSTCGLKLSADGYALVNGVVRGGVSMLPVALFLAWVTSAWWLLVLPAAWWAALLYLLLPSRNR
jgi:uncharacterized protein (DUF983 family)